MKGTDAFRKVLKQHLEDRGSKDPLFARIITKPGKNIDDCITYILNTVKKSGENGFSDDEIYSMAIHYFNEDKVEIGSPVGNVDIRVNQKVDLTAEDKAEAKKKAMDQLIEKEKNKILEKQKKDEEKKKILVSTKLAKDTKVNKTLF